MPTKEDLFDQAVDHVADGAPEAAVTAYRDALALDPTFADAWQGLALVLADLQRYDEAIAAGQKFCELEPDDGLSHTTLSRIYMQAGKVPEAEAEGGKARLLDWKRQLKEGQ